MFSEALETHSISCSSTDMCDQARESSKVFRLVATVRCNNDLFRSKLVSVVFDSVTSSARAAQDLCLRHHPCCSADINHFAVTFSCALAEDAALPGRCGFSGVLGGSVETIVEEAQEPRSGSQCRIQNPALDTDTRDLNGDIDEER